MGLLDNFVFSAFTSGGTDHASPIAMAAQFIQRQPGGITGLVQQLQNAGLDSVVSTWLGSGENSPIDPQQIESVIGSDRIQSIANTLGVDPQTLTQGLSQALPALVDHLSPNGQLPKEEEVAQGLQTLKNLL
ncbi:MAG: DUF937 domain-containing protein [Acidithiobacillus sp.]|nr:DUF937 domain-containing protein [Acidithiobacillus sp.]